jgi:hypothetical protein
VQGVHPPLHAEREDKFMKKSVLNFLSVLLLVTPAAASSSDSIPDATLRVAAQQRVEGKIVKGFHVLELSCRDGNCSLSTVSLNQCEESEPGKQAFYPKSQYSSTVIGNLKARNEGKSIVVQETGGDLFGNYVYDLRFDYEPSRDDKVIIRLTGFSGNYVKNSPAVNKVFKFDYVPLPKASQVMKLDCGALLPGIYKK